ncbi:TMTC4 family protein [Megaselia abdita]
MKTNLAVLVLCALCFGGTLNGSYVFDDTVAIVKNKDITRTNINLKDIFVHDFWGVNLNSSQSHKSYRPLTTLMFRMEYQFLNLRSRGMKFVNLFIHFLNSSLTFQLIKSLSGNVRIASFTAILFTIHPIHTEAVSGVVGRADLMFCSCFLVAVISRIRFKGSTFKVFLSYVLPILASIAGLFFKETAITILPTCVFIEIIRKRVNLRNIPSIHKILRHSNFYMLLITFGLLLFRLWIQNFESPKFEVMDNPIAGSDNYITKFLSQNFLYVLNLWLLICPHWLCFDWALGCVELVSTFFDGRVIGIIFMYLILFKLIQLKNREVYFGLGILVIPFLPASGIVRVGFVIAERILYVPSIGFSFLIAIGFEKLRRKLDWRVFTSLAVLICLILVFKTRERSSKWMTEEALFESGLDVCPNNAKVHYNIARLASSNQNNTKAFKHYHKAIELYPNYGPALMNLGNLYRESKDLETAESLLTKSLDFLDSSQSTAWMNLGIVQAQQKRYFEAEGSYDKAISLRRNFAVCYYNLGNLYLEMKRYSKAINSWQESVAINPKQPQAWANLLALLDNQELHEEALKIAKEAVRFLPNEKSVLFVYANILGKLSRYEDSEEMYKKVVSLDPRNYLYHTNLGVLYHRWGRFDKAIESYRNALKIKENSKTAKDNLEKLLKRFN